MSRRTADTVIAQWGELIVERDPSRPSGRLLLQGDMEASYVDLADPAYLEFAYLRWMRAVLKVARARRVLHIGGGACALPRALAAAEPGGRQQVCEVDGDVLALARAHLGLRRMPGLRVRRMEGRAFIAAQPDAAFEAIVIDAFVGAAVPRPLVTVEGLREAARVAALTLINVVDNRSHRAVRPVAAGLAACYPRVWSLAGREGNTVLVGARAQLNLAVIAAHVAADRSPARVVAPEDWADELAATVPYHDDDRPN